MSDVGNTPPVPVGAKVIAAGEPRAAADFRTDLPEVPAGRFPAARLGVIAVLLVGVAYATLMQSFSWNQTSHYDLIRALDHGKTWIDPYQTNTGDKVLYKFHYYSARAPGLALFALPFYKGLEFIDADSWARTHEPPGQINLNLVNPDPPPPEEDS